MTQPYTSGGVYIFIGLKPSPGAFLFTPAFLGHGMQPPEIETQAKYNPLFLDVGGKQVPADDIYAGREKISGVDLGRWNETVLQRLERFVDRGPPANNVDEEHQYDRGTIMGQEGFAFPVWYLFGRRNVPAMALNGMRPGHHLYYSRCITVVDRPGVEQNVKHVMFHHRALWSSSNGKFLIGDNNMTEVENLSLA